MYTMLCFAFYSLSLSTLPHSSSKWLTTPKLLLPTSYSGSPTLAGIRLTHQSTAWMSPSHV